MFVVKVSGFIYMVIRTGFPETNVRFSILYLLPKESMSSNCKHIFQKPKP